MAGFIDYSLWTGPSKTLYKLKEVGSMFQQQGSQTLGKCSLEYRSIYIKV